MISYEFPLNERVRTLLRLEDLYAKIGYYIDQADGRDHHVALGVLFEIMEVTARADLKSDLLQELERQKRVLMALHNNPEISEEALDSVLAEIELASSTLFATSGKLGQHLRENEWLMSIKQRACIPGGVCEFDLPSYHYWLHREPEIRRVALNGWLAPMLPIRDALRIVLRLLRESGKSYKFVAHLGSFQQMQGGRVAQLLRVRLDENLVCIPEVSANKYALNIRFVAADYAAKSVLVEGDVAFDLIFCSF
ncbi:MAG: cell division protein ZapD [Nitrosomonadales bacterium]|nr:cell division protein ZapD [Nitrosomonadales bacterium]